MTFGEYQDKAMRTIALAGGHAIACGRATAIGQPGRNSAINREG